jgi:sec-independent protein translocase protein TatA
MSYTLALGMPGFGEWILIAFLGLLFFGKRLPEVGRSFGKSIVEFKKGMKDIESEVTDAVSSDKSTTTTTTVTQQYRFDPQTGKPLPAPEHKFDPMTGEPLAEKETVGGGSSAAR